MKKKMSAGSGLSQHFLNREGKKVGVDFSGKAQDGECFRNDASILFFCANSYKSAFICLDKELNLRFENNYHAKDIEHLMTNSTEQVGSTRSTKVNLFHMVPLCYSSLENIPTQVSWGHATCNTRLGQRRCFSYHDLLNTNIKVEIDKGQDKQLLGYTNENQNFIRSKNGDVWIRISRLICKNSVVTLR